MKECEDILSQLKELAVNQPGAGSWYLYFKAILTDVRDHDLAEAERIYQQLLANVDSDRYLRGQILLSLGASYTQQGLWDEAIQSYKSTLLIFQELDEPIEQAKAWKNIAMSYHRGFMRGDFNYEVLDKAVNYCRLALNILDEQKTTFDVMTFIASIWNTLGILYEWQNQSTLTIQCFEKCLEIYRELDNDFGIGHIYGNLGEVYQKQGPDGWPKALLAYQDALKIFRKGKNLYEQLDVLNNLGSLHVEMQSFHEALHFYAEAIELIDRIRAEISTETARAGFFSTVAETYANTILTCIEADQIAQAFNYVEQARSRAFLDLLDVGSLQLIRESGAETQSLTEIQAALPSHALLLEYFTTGVIEARGSRTSTGSNPERHRFPPAKTLLFAITHDSIHFYDIGISPNDLYPADPDALVEQHFLEEDMRRLLYEALIGPVVDLIAQKQSLFLIPHGPLHYIPFQALVAPDADTLLRESGPHLVYAPSATILMRNRARSRLVTQDDPTDKRPLSCLAVGYNGHRADHESTTTDQETTTPQLRFAEEEAHSIAQLTDGHLLTGDVSKKDELFKLAIEHRLIHFSCHGAFNPEVPLESTLYLGPDESLTAQEALEKLRLNCDLVTLSACESGLSRVRRGDELFGLVRAFMYAGTPALVVTQWRVDERSTRILMERFYHNILDGMDFAQALHQAQIYLRTLTCKEAETILAGFIAAETKRLYSDNENATENGQLFSATSVIPSPHDLRQANRYLKSAVLKHHASVGQPVAVDSTFELDDDAKVFADPYHWAPFILIGA